MEQVRICKSAVIMMQEEMDDMKASYEAELEYYRGWRFLALQYLYVVATLLLVWFIYRLLRFVSWVCYRTRTGILNMSVWINPLNWFSIDLEKTSHYVPERVRDGSSLYIGEVPPIQCAVYVHTGPSAWNLVAQGFRYGKFFVSAAHAIRGQGKIMLRRGGVEVVVDEESFTFIDDLAYAVLGQDVFATLGIKTAVLVDVVGSAYVSTSAGGQKSNGKLKPAKFGFVEYDGSTLPGFSGSPYCINRQVYGMHLGGNDKTNMGYDAGFVRTLIEMFDEKRQKSYITTDQEWELMENMEFERAPGAIDHWIARTKGKYTILNDEQKETLETGGRLLREGKIKTRGAWKQWKQRENMVLGGITDADWVNEDKLVATFDHSEPEVKNMDFPKANIAAASKVGQQLEKAVVSKRKKRKSVVLPTQIAPLKEQKGMACPV